MKYFYGICIALVAVFSVKLALLEHARSPADPVIKSITPFPVFDDRRGCDPVWFHFYLQSSSLDPYTGGISCLYKGAIKKSECSAAASNTTGLGLATYADSRLECHQQLKKISKRIAVINEPDAPPKTVDCEKTWAGKSFVGMSEDRYETDICKYSGVMRDEECRALGSGAKIISKYDYSRQCRQQTPNGYSQVIDVGPTCDHEWFGHPLQAFEYYQVGRAVTCNYNGAIDRASCNKLIASAPASIGMSPEGIEQCVLPPSDWSGGTKKINIQGEAKAGLAH